MNRLEYDENTAHWLAWSHILNGRQLKKLFSCFMSGKEAWHAPSTEFQRLEFKAETLQKISEERARLDPQKALEQTKKLGIEVIMFGDPAYPPLLAQIYDAPVLFFYRGQLPRANELLIAIVGTRSVSRYGQAATVTLTRELATDGLGIVSGLARGIDAIAHESTLEVGGKTIGVLGTGLADTDIYPREHIKLARKIIECGGCLISEYPPGIGPEKHHFPERNRIIAGLTLGTLVVEAPATSGALITAKLALEYDREVMAVPGNIFEKNSAGTNDLIKLGAKVVTGAADVKEALQIKTIIHERIALRPDMTAEEKIVLNFLSQNPLHIDNIQGEAKINSAVLGSTLTLLELKGAVKDVGGKYYIRLIEP
ncbi:DNA protecting protein DprA [Candidatus Uhrbacteria bacterium RIFCSPLOWO2_12_FULL_46_10]|uniref:DNA protecting protein DprA n=1 Tax=Candidatus Uhrbacteria bacterium RIFCSPLOWO2_01_FULL_47_25 TaxID=1802402 RepID=A0A1F7UVZ6_9BACT|nr:MAG: DNA protecting protein DprA [Candidatus Uhrbacteria bacterium RIFCSPHIGHO2_01_FULL_46_23]OGL69875.1 MAG: DNA protecting protein DprA [Candidatus Uhrbacteria bacterium RIFCSPHIGHO2_02_FULL_47_29]OGL75644.1 MAG: DNA protecting protein DprA [Candidatus Uhrbacteria bacterium RIFCSPHIGHO2_12_FULL_46_13]OGL82472.1 MAG: DNA protecting protein DprA [Candidatus Uhrbacteria bacterium RIFCSPLOWO2_01_FULL_47_25]OGL85250.1 MAG: DNA protecting protein DprA [Candidatus Uhrbacteria bacterium RIFCSPLOWO